MRAVGIRELKSRLSEYVRLVAAGESVLVTDRGTVVAELCPPGAGAAAVVPVDPLAELARRGLGVAGAAHDPALYGPRRRALPEGVRVEDLLGAERTEGRGSDG
jgi:prevent-host-death family protein